jgi:hypothetical protein
VFPANPLLRRAVRALAGFAALAAVALAIIVAQSRQASRRAANDIRAVFTAQAPVLEQAQKRERQRDAALLKNLAQIAKEKRAAKKPADIARRLPAAFPPLPLPLSVSTPPLSPEVKAEPAAQAPTIITVPQADLKPLFDQLQNCRACQEQVSATQQNLSDERVKVSALTVERNAALNAARGGGFWSRFRTAVKWFAVGGALGALAASAVAHR